jgi:hypothetical protein
VTSDMRVLPNCSSLVSIASVVPLTRLSKRDPKRPTKEEPGGALVDVGPDCVAVSAMPENTDPNQKVTEESWGSRGAIVCVIVVKLEIGVARTAREVTDAGAGGLTLIAFCSNVEVLSYSKQDH